MAETITVIEKPEEITFEQIREVLWDANERNRRDGFYLSTASMPGEKLKERLGPDGKCFVALAHKDGADEPLLVGTISIRYLDRRRWYAKGRVADYMLAAVISSYQGKHINSMLAEKVFETAREANPGGDHYSVIMAKWLGKCPFSDAYCKLRYLAGKTLVKLRYTPDKKKRFGI